MAINNNDTLEVIKISQQNNVIKQNKTFDKFAVSFLKLTKYLKDRT